MDVKKMGGKSTAELHAIETTFPGLNSRQVVLAMAAWLATLCAIDDVMEAMEPERAGEALRDCLELLKSEDHGK
jgi:hypothetical protein